MRWMKYTVALGLLGLAAGLFFDASTFALCAADPSTGRARGCYTGLELLLGVKSPSWIRGAEAIAAVSLALVGLGLFVAPLLRRLSKRTTR